MSGCRARELSACGAGGDRMGVPLLGDVMSSSSCSMCANGFSCWHFLHSCLSFSCGANVCHSRWRQLLMVPWPRAGLCAACPPCPGTLGLVELLAVTAAGDRGCICPCAFCKVWNEICGAEEYWDAQAFFMGMRKCPEWLWLGSAGKVALRERCCPSAVEEEGHLWQADSYRPGWISGVHSQGRAAEQGLGPWALQGPGSGGCAGKWALSCSSGHLPCAHTIWECVWAEQNNNTFMNWKSTLFLVRFLCGDPASIVTTWDNSLPSQKVTLCPGTTKSPHCRCHIPLTTAIFDPS